MRYQRIVVQDYKSILFKLNHTVRHILLDELSTADIQLSHTVLYRLLYPKRTSKNYGLHSLYPLHYNGSQTHS
jgi:hypothetical protein